MRRRLAENPTALENTVLARLLLQAQKKSGRNISGRIEVGIILFANGNSFTSRCFFVIIS